MVSGQRRKKRDRESIIGVDRPWNLRKKEKRIPKSKKKKNRKREQKLVMVLIRVPF